MSSTWSSGVGKFAKKDPSHGAWGKKIKHTMKKIWNKIKHWCCKVGLCNLDKCNCDCHESPKGRSKAYYPTVKETRAKVRAKKVAVATPPPVTQGTMASRLKNLQKKD